MDNSNGMKNDVPPPQNYQPANHIREQFQRRYSKTHTRS